MDSARWYLIFAAVRLAFSSSSLYFSFHDKRYRIQQRQENKLVKLPGEIKLRSHHWIVDENNQIVMGRGRMEILERIEQTGSINQAAKQMKMSYKGVWSKIKSTEKHLKIKVVHSDKKTGSRLTKEGKLLLEKYKLLTQKCISADDQIFDAIFTSPKD